MRVACAPDAFDVRPEGGTLALHLDAVCGHQLRIDALADGGDHEVAGDLKERACSDRCAASGGVRLAKLHLFKTKCAVLLLDGSGQLDQLHALLDREHQLVLVGGHFLLRAAVDDGGRLRAHALCHARRVHGGVARADDDHMTLQTRLDLLLHVLHPADDALDVSGNVEPAGLPCAGGNQNMGVALLLERFDRRSRRAAANLNAVFFHQRNVLVDGLVGDAERRNDVARHTAEFFLTLKDGRLDTGSAEEVGRRNTGRAAADDGGFFALQTCRTADGSHQRAVALFSGDQLGSTDLDGFFVEIARAAVLAAVCADGAGDERQRVLLSDELQCRAVKTLAAELDILGDVLMDGAAALARRSEAVDEGHGLRALARGDGLDGLEMMHVGVRRGAHLRNGSRVGAGEGAVGKRLDLFDHLRKAVVSAGLEDGGGDGDGPDACGKQLVAVKILRAACKGNAHLARKLAGNAAAHLDGQREQTAAGHIHFASGQLAARGINGEGVGELEAEFQPLRFCKRLKPLEHRDGVGPLEILVEVVLVKDDVIITHRVKDRARGLVAEDGRIALDEGVKTLFRQQIRRDALNLLRRAAVQRGDGDGARDARRNGRDKVLFLREKLAQNVQTLAELRRAGGIHHAVYVAVDLFAPDALKVIADRHVEHEAVRVSEIIAL